ncbi:MAG: glycine dehydrogenase (aminomethyl-transferring) [Verrucomicrobia bacterium]|nr:MAG: glycine dehydrogenase (aminomethyl-transferring) [Verrucomicrobiota bacterium]
MSTVADHRTSETLDFTNQFVVFGRELRSQSSFPLLPSVGAFLPPRLDLRKRNSHEFIEIPQAGAWQGQRAPERSQSARGSAASLQWMLRGLGFKSLDSLIDVAVPKNIRLDRELNLPEAKSESEALAELGAISRKNTVARSFIGAGYYDCVTPAVIQRNILENPGWYTAYTPYQAEIAQGRLEALLNFQQMIMDLTALDIANASLLDEATAAAEAMSLCRAVAPNRKAFFVADNCHPQTIAVVQTRAKPLGIDIKIGDYSHFKFDDTVFGALVQYPATDGGIYDYSEFVKQAHNAGALVVVAADILALTLLKPPGEFGADVAVGSTQRFGVPLGFGGPHAAYFATRDQHKRHMPGRLVGVSHDKEGRPAYRLALQTREQHIRRDRATSNICTAAVFPAVIASMYAVYHGPHGLRAIAKGVHRLTSQLADGLHALGCTITHEDFFDTISVEVKSGSALIEHAQKVGCNLRPLGPRAVAVSLDETTTPRDIKLLMSIFRGTTARDLAADDLCEPPLRIPQFAVRTSQILSHPAFNTHHTETEMLRYIKKLESRDLSLTTSMIPLGSCTMKSTATAAMFPISWPEVSKLHPFAPGEQTVGYIEICKQLEEWLAEITGFAAVSLQPNAGSQGEFAGLLAIREYHASRNEAHRNVCLIPTSAHGTNPASAVMAGFKVVSVACLKDGNIDLAHLRAKADEHAHHLAVLMVTYPSTHGVFEPAIREICEIVHRHGGQVYLDGANMNAQVGLCRPGDYGADVCHLNLHKTFGLPHGGGGAGVGPIGVAKHLVEFLPAHSSIRNLQEGQPPWQAIGNRVGPVSAAPYGSASILTISWMYIRMLGAEGLKRASEIAILNANYIAKRLDPYFPVLFRGKHGLVAHECIIDLRQWKRAGIEVEDVAKRLMDYGFHAPTVSFPVAGTMLIEPTESEPQHELDRFCEAMISIHAEMEAIASGKHDRQNNLLKNAPHTARQIASDKWDRPYSREQAAFPASWTREHKFWPAVARIDNLYGDKNPFCACPSMKDFAGMTDEICDNIAHDDLSLAPVFS